MSAPPGLLFSVVLSRFAPGKKDKILSGHDYKMTKSETKVGIRRSDEKNYLSRHRLKSEAHLGSHSGRSNLLFLIQNGNGNYYVIHFFFAAAVFMNIRSW